MKSDPPKAPPTSATATTGTGGGTPVLAAAADTSRITYYERIEVSPTVEDPNQLVFIAAKGAPKAPEDLANLRQEYARTARVVAVLFADLPGTRKELFLQLHAASDRGLRGPEFNIEDGRANLTDVRDIVVDRAHRIRDQRLRTYTILGICFGVVPLLIGLALFVTNGFGYFVPVAGQPYNLAFNWLLATFWIPAGASICVWAEFALRMQAGLTYDQLLTLDPSRWRPGQRVLITIGISFIFAFLLATQGIQIGVASYLLNDFVKQTPLMALAVGGITGLAFPAVRDIIVRIKPSERTQI